jgi:hypothetical protein
MNLGLVRLDWRFVRSLGELQILTRVSYAMLVIVPILAGVWTALPLGEPPSRYLPHAWVFAFFAALAVTLGQVIYQLRAPEAVRHSTLDQYAREETRQYADQQTEARLDAVNLALDRASRPDLSLEQFIYYYPPAQQIAEIEETIEKRIRSDGRFENLKKSEPQSVNPISTDIIKEYISKQTFFDLGDYVAREAFNRLMKRLFYSGEKDEVISRVLAETARGIFGYILRTRHGEEGLYTMRHNITKAEYAARSRYLMEADRRKPAMLLASILHSTAIALISIITVNQTIAVITAAGWH